MPAQYCTAPRITIRSLSTASRVGGRVPGLLASSTLARTSEHSPEAPGSTIRAVSAGHRVARAVAPYATSVPGTT
eukprot:3665808-Rhodomonas_salina.3